MSRGRAFQAAAGLLEAYNRAVQDLVELPAEERRLVRAQARRLSRSNCAWSTYQAGQLFLQEEQRQHPRAARGERRRRERLFPDLDLNP